MKHRFPSIPSRYPRVISKLPVKENVRIITDRWGIPRIEAGSEEDLFLTQGFIHASERLWQMEAVRRFASGTLSEIAGESMLELDYFARLAGFPDVKRRALEGISDRSRYRIESYLSGINAYISRNAKSLPLEFRSAGITPEPWTISDVTANLAINSWYLQTNYLEEILAVRSRTKVNRAQWDAMMPGMGVFDGDELPEDGYFESLRPLRIGKFLPAAYAFFKEFSVICGASNNWVTADGPKGKPLLANDPHLGVQLPQIWYACGLRCPGIDVLGVGMPGFPGIVIGRNSQLAWGFTNVMTDIVDLYVMRVKPAAGTCVVDGAEHPISTREEVFRLPDGNEIRRKVHTTPHGPLLTELTPDADAAAALKWYGTLLDDAIEDRSADGILSFVDVKGLDDLRETGQMLNTIGQNIVAADTEGSISWQATGSIPVRKGYSGRLPADGSLNHDWKGFVPYNLMPSSNNPEKGFLATANHRTVPPDSPVMPTRSWAQPWRIRRITQRLEELGTPSIPDFEELQNDVFSMRPAHVLPTLLNCQLKGEKARYLADRLREWDGECRTDSLGCLVFNMLPVEICRTVLEPVLGKADLDLYYTLLPFFTSLVESIADDPDVLERFPGPDGIAPSLEEVMESSLTAVWNHLTRRFGGNPRRWKWGAWHHILYRHPGGKKGFASWFLNRGPWPMNGDWTTVNVCGFSLLTDPGEATTIPSMRFIASLADPDDNRLCMPLGQSGRPGNRHYDDFVRKYIRGRYVKFPMNPTTPWWQTKRVTVIRSRAGRRADN
jgi:penicillin amidase